MTLQSFKKKEFLTIFLCNVAKPHPLADRLLRIQYQQMPVKMNVPEYDTVYFLITLDRFLNHHSIKPNTASVLITNLKLDSDININVILRNRLLCGN